MRSRIAILAVAALVCACGSSSARPASSDAGSGAPRHASLPCGPGSARTLAADRTARVYVAGQRVLGCARGAGRSYVLGERANCLRAWRVAPVALSGELVAYGAERCGVDTGSSEVVVRSLRDGRLRGRAAANTVPLGVEAYVSVTALALARDGAVAWISSGGSIMSHRRLVAVHTLDRHGVRTLATGGAIVPGRLRLRGRTVSWLAGGHWHSAALA